MLVISDTTPIISLLKVNALDLLKKLFDGVIIDDKLMEIVRKNIQS